jgi:uncharacterized protein with HEPN domain
MFENDVQNIVDINEAIKKIQEYLENTTGFLEFEKNNLIFDAVLMNLVVIGESVNRLSEEFQNKYNWIEWSKIVGLRNVIAHNYFGIDVEEIWHIAKNTLPEFEIQIKSIMRELKV